LTPDSLPLRASVGVPWCSTVPTRLPSSTQEGCESGCGRIEILRRIPRIFALTQILPAELVMTDPGRFAGRVSRRRPLSAVGQLTDQCGSSDLPGGRAATSGVRSWQYFTHPFFRPTIAVRASERRANGPAFLAQHPSSWAKQLNVAVRFL